MLHNMVVSNKKIHLCINLLSDPGIPGWLYLFVPLRKPPQAADSCSRNNFWTTFWISFMFGFLSCWPWPITWLDFDRFSSWPWPWIFKVKYGICSVSAKKLSDWQDTKSKHIDWTLGLKCDQWVWPWQWPWPLNFEGQKWPWPLTTHMTLTMDFNGQILK